MYRDIITVAKSISRMAYYIPSVFLSIITCRFGHCAVDIPGKDRYNRLRNDIEFGVIRSGTICRMYLDMRNDGIDVAGVRFEDIVADPRDAVRRIFEFCRLSPPELVDLGLRAMNTHSQVNSPLPVTSDGVGRRQKVEATSGVIDVANEWMRRFGLPLYGEDFVLQGTITADYQRIA